MEASVLQEFSRKQKGDLAELKVAADLVRRGYRIALPYGEDWNYDLILCRGEAFERVQVKYARSNGEIIHIQCYSASLTNGKVRTRKSYTAETVDWIAAYDVTTDRCYYVSSEHFAEGRKSLQLRIAPTRNGQRVGIRMAADYLHI